MTSTDIHSTLDDSTCLACSLSLYQLRQIQTILLWKQLNGDTPMTADDIAATLSDASCLGCLSAYQLEQVMAELLWDLVQGGGGGGGSGAALEGANYCFKGTGLATELLIKNTDTGLANAIHADGVDGSQGTHLDNGEAC